MTANKLHFHLVFPLKKLASEIETVCQMVVSFFLFRHDNLIKERGPLSFTGLASCLCERYLRSVAHTQTHTHTHTHTHTPTHWDKETAFTGTGLSLSSSKGLPWNLPFTRKVVAVVIIVTAL